MTNFIPAKSSINPVTWMGLLFLYAPIWAVVAVSVFMTIPHSMDDSSPDHIAGALILLVWIYPLNVAYLLWTCTFGNLQVYLVSKLVLTDQYRKNYVGLQVVTAIVQALVAIPASSFVFFQKLWPQAADEWHTCGACAIAAAVASICCGLIVR